MSPPNNSPSPFCAAHLYFHGCGAICWCVSHTSSHTLKERTLPPLAAIVAPQLEAELLTVLADLDLIVSLRWPQLLWMQSAVHVPKALSLHPAQPLRLTAVLPSLSSLMALMAFGTRVSVWDTLPICDSVLYWHLSSILWSVLSFVVTTVYCTKKRLRGPAVLTWAGRWIQGTVWYCVCLAG